VYFDAMGETDLRSARGTILQSDRKISALDSIYPIKEVYCDISLPHIPAQPKTVRRPRHSHYRGFIVYEATMFKTENYYIGYTEQRDYPIVPFIKLPQGLEGFFYSKETIHKNLRGEQTSLRWEEAQETTPDSLTWDEKERQEWVDMWRATYEQHVKPRLAPSSPDWGEGIATIIEASPK